MVFSNLFPLDRALPFHRVGQHLLIARRVVITVQSSGTLVSVSVVTWRTPSLVIVALCLS